MRLVLDANEYIFSFGAERKLSCVELLGLLRRHPSRCPLSICRPLLGEIERHLQPRELAMVYGFLRGMKAEIDERFSVPFEFVERYLERGLKRGDAFVAGYAEWVGADCLISENRKDFIEHPELFPFQVLTAEAFLARHPRP